jgi:predicted GNAT family N-acyltransferase
MVKVEQFQFEDKSLFDATCAIREEVFVIEQMVGRDEEYDEYEQSAIHFLAYSPEGKPVATARWRVTDYGVKLERFAVLKPYRRKGFGEAILQKVVADVKPLNKTIYLNAQVSAMEFYKKNGFNAVGDLFVEANIDHYKMILG